MTNMKFLTSLPRIAVLVAAFAFPISQSYAGSLPAGFVGHWEYDTDASNGKKPMAMLLSIRADSSFTVAVGPSDSNSLSDYAVHDGNITEAVTDRTIRIPMDLENDKWLDRDATISEDGKTLTVEMEYAKLAFRKTDQGLSLIGRFFQERQG
jgi:hypothetical protein